MPTYALYGLRLESPLRFPELPENGASPDVTLALGPTGAPAGRGSRSWFRASPRDASMGLEGLGTIRVREGREILVDATDSVDEARLRTFLLGPAFSLLLVQRGLFPLHASALDVRGRAVALSARSGGGKSTTAAALLARGHDLLADDVAAIRVDRDPPDVVPGYPQLKLTLEALRLLRRSPDDLPRVHSREDRYALRLDRGFGRRAAPLARIYLLERGSRRGIDLLEPQEAFPIVARNCHRIELLRDALGPAELMARTARIAGAVPVFRVCVDFAAEPPDVVAQRIEAHALA